MQIKFWGTRGSIPRPSSVIDLKECLDSLEYQAKQKNITLLDDFFNKIKSGELTPFSYGGHTLCLEIFDQDNNIIIDAGSGIMSFSDKALETNQKEFMIFQTHLHWDHIIGFPFFVPLYQKGVKIKFYHVHPYSEDFVKILFNGVNFPVLWDQIVAEVEFIKIELYKKLKINSFNITPYKLDHPGNCYGYRIEKSQKALGIGVDGEYRRISKEDLGKDRGLFTDLDLLVFDGQYEIEELASRYNWGHSSPILGVDLALMERIKNLAVLHHDPKASSVKINGMIDKARNHLRKKISAYKADWQTIGQPEGPNIFAAYDGMCLKV